MKGRGQKEISKAALRDHFIMLYGAKEITGKKNTARMALWQLSNHINLV
jgi:hypothetical protein